MPTWRPAPPSTTPSWPHWAANSWWTSGTPWGIGIPPRPTFWIGKRTTGEGFRETHIAFVAPDRAAVEAFFHAGEALGAEVLHAPRVHPEYHPDYFGAFVRDPDGNNVEAVCHSPQG